MLRLALAVVIGTSALSAFADAPLRAMNAPPRIRFQVQRELGKFGLTTYPGTSKAMTSSLYYQDGKFGRVDSHRPYCSLFIHHTGNRVAPMPSGWVSITRVGVREAVGNESGNFRHDNQASLHFTYAGSRGSLDCQVYSANSHPISLSEFQESFGDLIRIERY